MRNRHAGPIASLLVLALACAALLLPAGCAPKMVPEPAWEKEAGALLDQADAQFSKRQYDQAAKTVDAFLYRYPTSRHKDRALYLLGDMRLMQRDYSRALNYYKEVLQGYPASSYITQARYKLGICYFELKDYDLAIANLQDRSKITDPSQQRRIAEMLSTAYLAKKNYPSAVKEFAALAETSPNEKQRAGYRDSVREIIEKQLSEGELSALAGGASYPSDIARLRLAALLIEQRQYGDAVKVGREFLEKFPNHPEKTRAEMLLNEATIGLTAPRFFLGALVPQTGQLAFFGDRVLKGIQLAVHAFNLQNPGDRAELLVKDTEGSPEKAVSALKELASKDVVAVVGPLLTKEAEAIAPELEKLKVPVITPAASGEDIGRRSPWLFRNALTNASQAEAEAQYAVSQKLKKFVVLYPDDPYGKDLARIFRKNLERRAVLLASIAYPPDVKDFGPYAKQVIEIDLRSRKIAIPEDDAARKKLFQEYSPSFDAVYLPGPAERIGLIIPQLAFYNITGVAFIGSNSGHAPDLIERAQRYAEGAVFADGFFPESEDPAIKQMVDAYRSAYQETPDILAAQAYDAAMMVLSLAKSRKNTPQAVRDGLLALKGYPGVSGLTTFPGNGEAQKKLFLIKVQNGAFVPAD
ncbi:MAG TPA: penicillin-binding protein activator [Nitrospirota bacterium]